MDTLLNPSVIMEILPKSIEAYDRGEKFAQYHTLDTLLDYLLVSQDRPLIESFTRQPDGVWLFTESAGLDAVMPIESIQCRLPLVEVYDWVEFDQASSGPKLRWSRRRPKGMHPEAQYSRAQVVLLVLLPPVHGTGGSVVWSGHALSSANRQV